jgi:signal transduction histidine kinase
LVTLSAFESNAQLVIAVRDEGFGFDSAGRAKLFRFLSQGQPAGERSLDGLGIGLALTSALVAKHGGEISALSAGLGLGSEFSIRLPLVE